MHVSGTDRISFTLSIMTPNCKKYSDVQHIVSLPDTLIDSLLIMFRLFINDNLQIVYYIAYVERVSRNNSQLVQNQTGARSHTEIFLKSY